MKIIIVAVVMSMLVACSGQKQTVMEPVEIIKYKTVQVKIPAPTYPRPDQVKMRPVVWKVTSQENTPLFSLDTNNYKNLTLNLNDLRAYIEQTNKLVYKHTIE